MLKVNDKTKDIINDIVQKYQARIRNRIDDSRGKELDIDEAKDEVIRLERFAKRLEPDFQIDLDELIRENLINTGNALLEEYKNKLASLTEELETTNTSGIIIDPLRIMGGSIVDRDLLIKQLTQSKEVEDGKEWVENTSKKWYKPWTWFQEEGYYRQKYKTVKYVDASNLAQEFLAPVQKNVYDNGDKAGSHVLKQSEKISRKFKEEFKRLDNVLKDKLEELESFATDREKAEDRIRESESKLKWLETIKAKVESILEI